MTTLWNLPESANKTALTNAEKSRKAKPRLTKEQRKALEHYQFCERQEDRYLGSVFVTPSGQRQHEARTQEAYQACKALGMTYEHGL